MAASALAVLIVASGCASVPIETARDPSVTIASSTRFDFEQFEGVWRMRAATDVGTAPDWLAFSDDDEAGFLAILSDRECPDTTACPGDTHALTFTGPGRFRLRGANGQMDEFWVLWVDADFRTAAIGTPNGRFGWIIDRAKTGGSDRIAAAHAVMAFNGYDVTKLKVAP